MSSFLQHRYGIPTGLVDERAKAAPDAALRRRDSVVIEWYNPAYLAERISANRKEEDRKVFVL